MILPDPTPGLVIRFDYTFFDDRFRKERPCAIVLASKGTGLVTVVPISHSYPEVGEEDNSMLIPQEICAAMGLDGQANWVRVDEVNRFEWPSDRISALPDDSSRCEYGIVPEDFFLEMRKRLAAVVRENRMKIVTV